jgi:hypothetical protein
MPTKTTGPLSKLFGNLHTEPAAPEIIGKILMMIIAAMQPHPPAKKSRGSHVNTMEKLTN